MRIDTWLTTELKKLEFNKTNEVINTLPDWIQELDIIIYSQKYDPDQTKEIRNSVRTIANSLLRIVKDNETDFYILIKILRKIGVMGRAGRDGVRSWTGYSHISDIFDISLKQRKELEHFHEWLKKL